MKITKKIARRIKLKDDCTETGGISYVGETLDNFMEECSIPYGTTLNEINPKLVANGIQLITEQEAIDAENPFTVDEEEAFERIARLSKMDCWFGIDNNGRVYDREGDIKGKTNAVRKTLVSQLIDNMIKEDWDLLVEEEQFAVVKALGKLVDNDPNITLRNNDGYKQINQIISKHLNNDINKFIEFIKNNNIDILGFKHIYKSKYKKDIDNINNLNIKINIDFSIDKKGISYESK